MQHNYPLYLEVKQDLEDSILSGKFLPGQEFPSVRSLAVAYRVNPNTIQRALELLREDTLIRLDRKRFSVTADAAVIRRRSDQKAKLLVAQLRAVFTELGYSWEEAVDEILRFQQTG